MYPPATKGDQSDSSVSYQSTPSIANAHLNQDASRKQTLKYFPDRSRGVFADLKELIAYRELLWMFFLRDLKIRYRQVLVGVLWVLLQPTLGMLIFLGIFWLVNAAPASDTNRYASSAAIVYVGMLVWQFVGSSLRDATGSLVNYRHVITKIAFPRLLLPLSNVLCAAFDLLVASLLLPLVLWFWHDDIRWSGLLFIPIVGLVFTSFLIGAVAWLSSLNAFYRDVGYALPFMLQLGMFVSPVIYDLSRIHSSTAIPMWVKILYESNPIANAIGWTRALLLGAETPLVTSTILATVLSISVLISGLAWFRSQNERLADRI